MQIKLQYEFIESWEELHKIIQDCEGRHTQQVVVSTFHDGLTQIDWTDMKIRSTVRR